ncbi:5-oxoprolinase subunit B family protein [Sciscionella marina]|uniref:5-oxoprolinase subunit B family protein n=1 Tax=Sciscionella marina TaxID=508770 RepID=UPI00035EC9FF|nr:allophanate hydrolase subunit 1 [Sciscionella marina]
MRLLPYGADGVLAEFDSIEQVRAAHRAVLDSGIEASELVPAARTLLVTGAEPERVRSVLAGAGTHAGEPGKLVRVPVRYTGPDIELIAETAGCTVAEVAELHASVDYTVAFCGFSPGFGYLTGLPAALHQPRLPSPRTSVPTGSVAIAGEFSAIYPRSSPGGWRLLGATDVVLFDPRASVPALLRPGDLVRFEPCAG